MENENNTSKKRTLGIVITIVVAVILLILVIIGISAIYVLQGFGHILGGTAESIFPLREE
jgi:flagellar basal body-associated protein FliL